MTKHQYALKELQRISDMPTHEQSCKNINRYFKQLDLSIMSVDEIADMMRGLVLTGYIIAICIKSASSLNDIS